MGLADMGSAATALPRRLFRPSAAVLAIGAAVAFAAPAPAAPECADIGPTTWLCQNPGHIGMTTSPDPALTNHYPGWGYGGFGVPAMGFGGGGIWIGL